MVFPLGTVGVASQAVIGDNVVVLDGWLAITDGDSFVPSAGTNRLVVVGSHAEADELDITGATYGDQAMTVGRIDTTDAAGFHSSSALFYIDEAGLAAATGTAIAVAEDVTSQNDQIFVATFQNVSQASPKVDDDGSFNNTGSAAAITLTTEDNGLAIAIGGSGIVSDISWTGITEQNEEDDSSSSSSVAHIATSGANVVATPTFSSANRSSVAGISLRKHTSFVPSDIANLQIHLDGSNAGSITESSSEVSQWDTLTAEGHDPSQGFVPGQPNTATINSNEGIFFDGGDEMCDRSLTLNAASPLTMAVVFTPTQTVDGGGTDRRVILSIQQTGGAAMATVYQTDGDDLEYFHTGNDVNLVASAALTDDDTKWVIIRARDGADGDCNLLDNDGNTATQTAAGALDDTGDEFGLGAEQDLSDGFEGHIHEILVYAGTYASDSERDDLEAYLNSKWNV